MERLNRTVQMVVADPAYLLAPTDIGFSPEVSAVFALTLGSSIVKSTMAGAFALTMAQFNLYDTKHEFDSGFVDKAVLWIACFFNTLSVLAAETAYFCLAFPSLFLLMLYVLRVARGEMVRQYFLSLSHV